MKKEAEQLLFPTQNKLIKFVKLKLLKHHPYLSKMSTHIILQNYHKFYNFLYLILYIKQLQ